MTLVERLRAREAAAFREAYNLWGSEVYRFLFQETWLQLVRYAPRLRDDSNVPAWMCVVARNAYRKHRRFVLIDRERLRQWRFALMAKEGDAEAPLELTRRLEQGLYGLPAADREIILLATNTEASQDALAALLEMTPAALRQRLSRARRRLAKEVANDT